MLFLETFPTFSKKRQKLRIYHNFSRFRIWLVNSNHYQFFFSQTLKSIRFQNIFNNDIAEPDIQWTSEIFDFDSYWKHVGLDELSKKFKRIRSTRSLWLVVERNKDFSCNSTLYVIRANSFATNRTKEGSNILFSWQFKQRDIMKRFQRSKMHIQSPAFYDTDELWKQFQQWETKNLLSHEELLSWKPIVSKTEAYLNTGCQICSQYKRSLAINSLKKMHNLIGRDARKKQKKKLKKIQTEYQEHVLLCAGSSESRSFHKLMNQLYRNATDTTTNIWDLQDSKTEYTNLLDVCQENTKWASSAIHKIFSIPKEKTYTIKTEIDTCFIPTSFNEPISIDFEIPICTFNVSVLVL